MLVGLGAVTAIPLIVYANSAKLLKLSTIAMLQYIAPTLIFLVAVFLFGEEFGWAKKVAFPMIWVALLIFTSSSGNFCGSKHDGLKFVYISDDAQLNE